MEKIFYFRQNLKDNGRTIKLLMNHSAKLYNRCLYLQNRNYELGKKYITWVQMRELMVDDVNFKLLGESLAVSVIRNLDINFKNYFMNNRQTGNLKAPKYRKEKFFVSFFGVYIRRDGYLNVGLSSAFKARYGIESFKFKVTPNFIKKGVSISQMRLHDEGYVVFHYKQNVEPIVGKAKLGLDLGVDNLVSGFCTAEKAPNFVVDGKLIKYVNYRLLGKNEKRRQQIINDYFNQVIFYLERYIKKYSVGDVVVGFFKDIKKKHKGRNFYFINYVRLRRKIRDLCVKLGVGIHFTEESYTSKTCFYLSEDIKKNESSVGYREVRGLFKIKGSNIRYNCDINGAANIICKKFTINDALIRAKVLKNPIRLKRRIK